MICMWLSYLSIFTRIFYYTSTYTEKRQSEWRFPSEETFDAFYDSLIKEAILIPLGMYTFCYVVN